MLEESDNTSVGELTPLLNVSPEDAAIEISKRDTREPYIIVAAKEARWITVSAIPSILTMVLLILIYLVNFLAVSHLGATMLSGMSLAITTLTFAGVSPSLGLISATDTFCSNAYTASSDKKILGLYFQRGLFAILIHVTIASVVLWYIEPILLSIGIDAAIARYCGIYMYYQIPGLPAYMGFQAVNRYMQTQGIMHAGTIILMVVTPAHWVCIYIFVHSPTYGIGFIGAPIVTTIAEWIMFVGIVVVMVNSRAIDTWGGWDRRALQNMSDYYHLAIPAMLTVSCKWFGFDFIAICTSYFGTYQLAGQAILVNTAIFLYRISVGLSVAASARVGNLIGAGKPRQAHISADVSIALSALVGLLSAIFMLFFNGWWASVFTEDPDVVYEIKKLAVAASIFIFSDSLNAVLSPVLRGIGQQKASANVYILGFLLATVPIGLYLGFHIRMESVGVWWGMCAGSVFSNIFQLTFIYKVVDWKDEVRRCLIRLQRSSRGHSDAVE